MLMSSRDDLMSHIVRRNMSGDVSNHGECEACPVSRALTMSLLSLSLGAALALPSIGIPLISSAGLVM